MNATFRRAACSWVVVLGGAALVLAQQALPPAQPRATQPQTIQPGQTAQPRPGQPIQPGQVRPGAIQGQQQLEPSIVTLLIIDNNKEIALSQLGQQTSQNDDVKQFCEMLVKDHSDFVQKLQERSGPAGRPQRFGAAPGAAQSLTTTQPAQPGQPGADLQDRDATQPRRETATAQDRQRETGDETRTALDQNRGQRDQAQEWQTAAGQERGQSGQRITVAKPAIPNQPGSELLQLHHEVAEKCLDTARKEAQKHGADFDKHFLGAQILAHMEMLDKLAVYQNHVSPQTRQLLADAQEATRKHLEEAKGLHEKLSQDEGGRAGGAASRRTETRSDRE